jgi:hypothetical protein
LSLSVRASVYGLCHRICGAVPPYLSRACRRTCRGRRRARRAGERRGTHYLTRRQVERPRCASRVPPWAFRTRTDQEPRHFRWQAHGTTRQMRGQNTGTATVLMAEADRTTRCAAQACVWPCARVFMCRTVGSVAACHRICRGSAIALVAADHEVVIRVPAAHRSCSRDPVIQLRNLSGCRSDASRSGLGCPPKRAHSSPVGTI